MDDPRWLRLITVGIVLAVLAVGYYIFTGAFSINKSAKTQTEVNQITQKTPSPTIIPLAKSSPLPSSKPSVLGNNTNTANAAQSAYDRIVQRAQNQVETLPKTGFPLGAALVFSSSLMIIGLGLRRYPN